MNAFAILPIAALVMYGVLAYGVFVRSWTFVIWGFIGGLIVGVATWVVAGRNMAAAGEMK